MRLAASPLDPALPRVGEARSRSCGSTLTVRLEADEQGRIVRLGCRAHACAIGQAAASLFVDHAPGLDRAEIAHARAALAGWLAGAAAAPDWPGIGLLERARGYPARHGAILLAWDAALAALAPAEAVG